jgi:hypothetical protein
MECNPEAAGKSFDRKSGVAKRSIELLKAGQVKILSLACRARFQCGIRIADVASSLWLELFGAQGRHYTFAAPSGATSL